MQRWEYKLVVRAREFTHHDEHMFGPTKWNLEIDKTLEELGNEGWELVTVAPRSDLARAHGTSSKVPSELAGYTTTELWVFKRPKIT